MLATVFVGTSVDGFIARTDGGIDWLPEECEPHGFEELFSSVDALVMGSKTYEFVLSTGQWFYGSKPLFMLSSKKIIKPKASEAVVERMSGEPNEIVAELEKRGIKHAYVDGGYTIHSFLRAGLIGRLIITRIPILIGEGIPLFSSLPADVTLKHIATREFPSGLVQSEYHIPEAGGSESGMEPLWRK